MDWKDMEERPDEGLFEQIRRRLVVRRALRVGLPAVAVLGVALGATVLLRTGHDAPAEPTPTAVARTVPQPTPEARAAEVAAAPMATAQTAKAEREADLRGLLPEAEPQVAQVLPPVQETRIEVAETEVNAPSVTRTTRREAAAQEADTPITDVAEAGSVGAAEEQASAPAAKAGEREPEPYREDDLLWAPNIIVPNGEVEENRTFGVRSSSELASFRIHIYNRRGQRIFSSTEQDFRWDGTFEGQAVPQGAYVWVATFRDGSGKSRTMNGTVMVVR